MQGRQGHQRTIAQGASDLRDIINGAWLASPPQTYQDIEAGKIKDLYTLLYGDS